MAVFGHPVYSWDTRVVSPNPLTQKVAGVAGPLEGALVVLGPVRPPLLGTVCEALCALLSPSTHSGPAFAHI